MSHSSQQPINQAYHIEDCLSFWSQVHLAALLKTLHIAKLHSRHGRFMVRGSCRFGNLWGFKYRLDPYPTGWACLANPAGHGHLGTVVL